PKDSRPGHCASRNCAWGQRDILPKHGTSVRPEKLCLRDRTCYCARTSASRETVNLGDNGTCYHGSSVRSQKTVLGTTGHAKNTGSCVPRNCA
ncbi:hypothetical protein AVEN_44795-1, partial [Araneus ventricosus]